MKLKNILHMGSLSLRFRNGSTLVRQMRASVPSEAVVLWDGTRIAHPPARDVLQVAEHMSQAKYRKESCAAGRRHQAVKHGIYLDDC